MIPFKPADDVWSTLAPGLAMLVALLIVVAIAAWYARRRGFVPASPARRRRLRVVERVALSRQASLFVVEYEGRTLLVGDGATGLSLLSDAPAGKDGNAGH